MRTDADDCEEVYKLSAATQSKCGWIISRLTKENSVALLQLNPSAGCSFYDMEAATL